MIIKNISKHTILSTEATELRSLKDKTKGLLGTTMAKAVIIKTRWGIHTFGMNYPIDIIILSNTMQVVALKKHLLQGNVFLWNPRHTVVIELPAGMISRSKTVLGDYFSFT
jgi:uncharacterized membrane protein (UPF0127 family)